MEKLKKYSAGLSSIVVLIVYIFTLAPSVTQIDAGELAAVQSTLGIAHPTGYPLFTMIGYLFLKLPLPFTHIFTANLLAAIWCSLGILLFVKTSQVILTQFIAIPETGKKSKGKKEKKINIPDNEFVKIMLPSVAGGFLLAFSKTYWIQSASVEVYSMQIFLFNLIFYSVMKAFFADKNSNKYWMYVAVSLALGFSNHMTTLLTLPFVAVFYFKREKLNISSIKKIGLMLCVFFPILILIYLYLPLRAATDPQINWGNVINFENFWRHFTGKQYQVWLFSSFSAAKKQLAYFTQNLPSEFAYAGYLIIIAGIYYSYKNFRIIFYGLITTFLFTVLYSINYDIVDIDSYFLPAYIMLGFFAIFGFYTIAKKFQTKISITSTSILILLFCCFELIVNFDKTDLSGNYTFEDYTKAILENAGPNSVIFTYTWDYFVSPSYYFQYSEGLRKDVAVIDKELLRRSWYYNQMERDYPRVIKNLHTEINNFLVALKPFERDENFNSAVLERDYRTIMTKLVAENSQNSFYIGLELVQDEMAKGQFSLPDGFSLVPDLFMFKAVKGSDYVPAKDPNFNIRFPENSNKYIENIKRFIGSMLSYRAEYELNFNKPERAKVYIEKIQKDLPDFRIPSKILQQLNNR